jgi:dolichol-phosphate mannosyltransferase
MKPLLVLPTYNEAQNIEEVISKVQKSAPSCSILVVDDSSPDKTAEIVKKLSESNPKIYLLQRPGKMGLGSAYRTGFKWGMENGFDVFIEMDSDLSHDPEQINDLLSAIAQGYDVAIGSRYIPGGKIPNWSFLRKALSVGGNLYAKWLLGFHVNDSTSGFRAYRAEILKQINLERITAEGYGFQIEMTFRAYQSGGKIKEVPITFVDRVRGTSKMSSKIVTEALFLVTKWSLERFTRNKRG